MRIVKTIVQSILHPHSQKKRHLWCMGLLALFCVVSFLVTTGAMSTPALAAEHVPLQPGRSAQSQKGLSQTSVSQSSNQTACNPQAANCPNIQNPIATNSTLLFFTDPAYTTNAAPVSILWKGMLYVVDGCIVIVLTLNSIVMMLGGSVFRYSRAIEALPGILLALIVAHVSMYFIALMLALNNTLDHGIYNWTVSNNLQSTVVQKQQFQSSATSDVNDHSDIWSALPGNTSGYDNPPANATCTPLPESAWDQTNDEHQEECTWPAFIITPQGIDFTTLDIPSLMKTVPGALDLMIDVMGLMLVAQIVIRIFFIDLYTVLAPIGIGCWALPANVGRGVTSMWFKGFISTVLVQFVQMTAIIVLQLILGSLMSYLTGPGKIGVNVLSTALLTKLINVAFLWFIFRIPSMFNTAPMRSMVEIGQTMSQTMSAFVGMQFAEAQATTAEIWGGVEGLGGLAAMFLVK